MRRDHINIPASSPISKPTSRKRGRPSGSTNKCSKPKALRGVKASRIELTPSPHNTETESQLHLNESDTLSCNTPPRNDNTSNQHTGSTFQMNTTSDKDCNMEPTDTHHDVNAEQTVAYLDTIDQMKATEDPSSRRPSDLCTQSHHMKQNMDKSASSNNQYMSATETQVQQFHQADYINFHTNHTYSSNRLYTDNNHYHDTALSSIRNSITSFQIDPAVQNSGGTEYNTHWNPADHMHYNPTPAQQDICHDNVHWPCSEDTSLEDMTTTAALSTDPNWITQRHSESAPDISSASNDSMKPLYTNTRYFSGSIMSHTGTGINQPERPTRQEVEQGTYPQESATRVISTGKASLTSPQSGRWETRTGNGCSTGTTSETFRVCGCMYHADN